MKITPQDIVRLRWSLALVAITLLAAGGAVTASRHFVGGAEVSNRQLTAQVNDIRGRLGRAREEEQDILKRITRYQQLVEQGVIGPEARLDWVEEIARIKAERRLLDVKYELKAQAPLAGDALPTGTAPGGYEVMASTMRLEMQLLHENDLLGFLDDLRQRVRAHLLVRECAIRRGTRAPAAQGIPAQLEADCLVDWITLREKK